MRYQRAPGGVAAFPAPSGIHHHPPSAWCAHCERIPLPDIDDMQLEATTAACKEWTPYRGHDEGAGGHDPGSTSSRGRCPHHDGGRGTGEHGAGECRCNGPHGPRGRSRDIRDAIEERHEWLTRIGDELCRGRPWRQNQREEQRWLEQCNDRPCREIRDRRNDTDARKRPRDDWRREHHRHDPGGCLRHQPPYHTALTAQPANGAHRPRVAWTVDGRHARRESSPSRTQRARGDQGRHATDTQLPTEVGDDERVDRWDDGTERERGPAVYGSLPALRQAHHREHDATAYGGCREAEECDVERDEHEGTGLDA